MYLAYCGFQSELQYSSADIRIIKFNYTFRVSEALHCSKNESNHLVAFACYAGNVLIKFYVFLEFHANSSPSQKRAEIKHFEFLSRYDYVSEKRQTVSSLDDDNEDCDYDKNYANERVTKQTQ